MKTFLIAEPNKTFHKSIEVLSPPFSQRESFYREMTSSMFIISFSLLKNHFLLIFLKVLRNPSPSLRNGILALLDLCTVILPRAPPSFCSPVFLAEREHFTPQEENNHLVPPIFYLRKADSRSQASPGEVGVKMRLGAEI